MCEGKVFAGAAFEETPFDGFARGEGDGVDEAVQPAPLFAKTGEDGVDFGVACHVAGQEDFAAKFGAHFFDARFEFVVLVGEGEFGAFAVHGLGDAVGDGEVAGKAGDEDFFAAEEAHGFVLGFEVIENSPPPQGEGLFTGYRRIF